MAMENIENLSEENSIEVCGVTKIYRLYSKPSDRLREALSLTRKRLSSDYYALKNVDFTIRKGETLGIIGVNGAGKSTILKIITGVLSPTSGSVRVNGKISALLELGAGFNMEYTGIENVYLNGTMNGYTRSEIDEKLDGILEFADIGDFVYQPVKTYSSGMFVRLAFAVAINIDPDILIVDEALSVGDVFFQSKCYKKFEEFKQKGKTILFVSHSLGTIGKYCDRVVLLNKGEKVSEGEPSEMIDLFKKILVNQDIDNDAIRRSLENDSLNDLMSDGKLLEKLSLEDGTCWKDKLALNPKINSYGNMDGEIIDFAIVDSKGEITNALVKGTAFSVKMKAKFNKEISDPVFAFTILNLQGTEICGTNTMYEKTGFQRVFEGDVKIVTFTQNIDIQGGEYLLSLGLTGYRDGEFTVYHRLYEVCNITVVSEKNTVGFYDMNSKIEIE